MKVTEAEIVISAVSQKQYPQEGLSEIALIGRSNVGKSSLINKMINRKALARTSSKPGKTQTLNFYKINNKFFFVDLPGYGFAKVSKKEREKWGLMIEEYLLKRDNLKLVVLITDLRHPPSKDDQLMYDWLKYNNLHVIIIGTKADKLSKGKLSQHLKILKETLNADPEDKIILFSSDTGYGKSELWNELSTYI